ncbi:uncharacterized protein TRIREDRAFT_110007 [Trichoderma reesei QM6a]|uniref:Predicted protein n=1 Tax=Hypocrea jecorina (strain QM6a) TaxID=431241 RepID=G0RQZ4_HYPJQ|nr:uncharacterized protein TRIREDRAFT_110007 [Trichoderma reesei QM6a]EGR46433.1 predicted protein [Trichoderma reesei QM6a]
MTKPVESASHKGQRRPDVPKCRRLQLEALACGRGREGAGAASHVQRKPDKTRQTSHGAVQARRPCALCVRVRVRVLVCVRVCCSLALEHVAPDPKGQTKTRLDGQAEHICTDLATHGSQRLRDPSYAA